MVTTPNPGKAAWPSDFQGCTITGTYETLLGDPLVGSVQFFASPVVLLDQAFKKIIVPTVIEAELDVNGHFSIVVPATDDPDISPTAWTYLVKEKVDGGRQYSIAAPQNQTIDLVAVSPTPASSGQALSPILSISVDAADARYDAAGAAAAVLATAQAGDTAEAAARATAITNAVAAEATARQTAINTAVTNLINGAPGALDTLKELADAIADDANYASTITTALANKAAKDLSNVASDGRQNFELIDYAKMMPSHAGLVNRRADRWNCVLIGDSLQEGYPVSSFDRTTAMQLALLMRARFPTLNSSGSAVIPGGRGFIGIPTTFFTTGDPGVWPITFTGGSFDDTFYGCGAKHRMWYSNVVGNKAIFTLASPITSFDINHMKNTAGSTATGYYKIDGGAPVTFPTNNATNLSTVLHVATPANSTIEIGVNDAHYLFLEGITEYNGDEVGGIQVHNCGQSSYTTSSWMVNPNPTGGWVKSIKNLNPDVIVIQLGMNDANVAAGNLTPSQFAANLTSLIALLRGQSINCPVVLSMVWGTGLTYNGGSWAAFVAAAKGVATADQTVICVDHSARMPAGNASNTYGLYHTDNAHGAAAGGAYAYVAHNLLKAFDPR